MAQRPTLTQAVPKLARIAGRFRPEIRRERLLIGSSIVGLVLEAAMRLAEPWPIKFVLDRVIAAEAPGAAGGGGGGGMSTTTLLYVCGGAVIAIAALRALAAYGSTVGLALAGNRVLTTVRARLYAHIQRLSLSYHSRARTGDLVTRVTSDIGRLQDVTVTAAMPLVANCLTLTGMVVVMLVIDWRLGLLACVVLPLFGLSLVRRSGPIRTAARRMRRREGDMAAQAAESISAIHVVQALSLEEELERSFATSNRASLREGVQTKRLSAGLERRVDVIAAIGGAAVLVYGATLVRRGDLTPGTLVVFLLYLRTAFKPMRDMAKYTARLASAAAAGERVVGVLDTEPEIVDRPGALAAPPLAGDVRFAGVSLEYEPGTHAVREVDFELPAGRTLALVGPSGGGKSTIANLLLRLYEPGAGRVLVDGRDVRDYTLESLRRQVAVVLQESVLFAVSARENIRYGRPGATDEEVEAAARMAKAHDFIMRLPDGYDTVLGERGATLSGGERQRIAIARAAVRDAPIVILDEPTTGLDEHNERTVWEALEKLAAGRSTLLITHDVLRARRADLILYVERGRIVERGTHTQLLALDGRYATVHALQAAAGHHPAPVPAPARA